MKKNQISASALCVLIMLVTSPYFLAAYSSMAAVILAICGAVASLILFRGTRFVTFTILFEISTFLLLGTQLFAMLISLTVFSSVAAVYIYRGKGKGFLRGVVVVLCSLAGCAATYFMSHDLLMVALTVIPAIIGIAGAVALKAKITRTEAIALIAVILLIPVAVVALLAVKETMGVITIDSIKESIDSLRTSCEEYIFTYMEKMLATIDPKNESGVTFSRSDAKDAITSLFNILPGVIIASLSIIAYFIHRFILSLTVVAETNVDDGYESLFEASTISKEQIALRMSVVSASFFALAAIVNLFSSYASSDTAALTFAVCQNIIIALLPGFVGTGITVFFERRRAKSKRRPVFPIWLIISIAIFMPSIFISIVAYYGTFQVIHEEISAIIKRKNQNNK